VACRAFAQKCYDTLTYFPWHLMAGKSKRLQNRAAARPNESVTTSEVRGARLAWCSPKIALEREEATLT
jgi:hypothetical protein